jgi:hypothetical protein
MEPENVKVIKNFLDIFPGSKLTVLVDSRLQLTTEELAVEATPHQR